MSDGAFQDRIPNNLCFGCGPHNELGLRVKSYWDGAAAVCTWQPSPHQAAGPPGILNGGIIATVIDCHTVCTAIADAYRRESREIGSAPDIWYATGTLNVRYVRAVPIDRAIRLRARIVDATGRKTRLFCSLLSSDVECASAEVVAIRVSADWRHGA